MGYYTDFTLIDVEGGTDDQCCPTCGAYRASWDWNELISKFIGKQYGCDSYNPFDGSCKWYDYEEHMAEFSTHYPEYTFTLEGNGDEEDDRWRAYFKNGAYYKDMMEMAWPEFQEDKLK